MTTTANEYARRAVEAFRSEYAGIYDQLSDDDKKLIYRCFRRAGIAQASELLGVGDGVQDRKDVVAQLSSLTSGSAALVVSGFWNVVKKLAEEGWQVVKSLLGVK